MKFKVFALENHLKSTSKPFVIRSHCDGEITQEQLSERIAAMKSTLSKQDAFYFIDLFGEAIAIALSEGNIVRLNFGRFGLTAGGTLDTEKELFTPGIERKNHHIEVHFAPGKSWIKRIVDALKWDRVEYFDHSSAKISHFAISSGDRIHAVSGATVRLDGLRMKFDPDDESCGVFLIDGLERIRISSYAEISQSLIIAILPEEIASGEYEIMVATKPTGSDLKIGSFSDRIPINQNH